MTGARPFAPIDLLVVNLYPFEATRRQRRPGFEECIEKHRYRRPCDDPPPPPKNHDDVAVVVEGR